MTEQEYKEAVEESNRRNADSDRILQLNQEIIAQAEENKPWRNNRWQYFQDMFK